MGHEYVELKNSPAAIEAYRRAVEINPRDYRAWCVWLQLSPIVDSDMGVSMYHYLPPLASSDV